MGEQEPALECGEDGEREVVGVGPAHEVASRVHRAQAVSDAVLPAPESDRSSNITGATLAADGGRTAV